LHHGLRRIKVGVARPGDPHGSGLGRKRWVVERRSPGFTSIGGCGCRYERHADIHEALLTIGLLPDLLQAAAGGGVIVKGVLSCAKPSG
jgi:hypothetical protein